jgi:ribose 5-phosphate isomerase RpiB
VGTELARDVVADIIGAYLTTEFEGGRHQRRLDKISALEG